MRKILSFTIIALLLLFLPRQASISTAADCFSNGCDYSMNIQSANYSQAYSQPNYTPPPVRLPQPPATPNRNSGLTLTSNQAYCVGQTPSYSIYGTPNASAIWTSWFNGRQTNQLTLTLNSSGNFTGSGNTWQSRDIGQWTKQATVNGQSQSLQFSVSNCNNNSSSQTSQNTTVTISDNFFSPNIMTVAAGTTIKWTNMGRMMHTVTSDNNLFSSGTLNPGSSFSQTFSTPGTYRYYCRFHGAPGGVGMSGMIVVTANSNTSMNNPNPSTGNNTNGNTYYDPYNNNLFGSTNNNYSGNSTNGNTYYDPYNNNLLSPANNSNANTYYNPYNNNLLGGSNQNGNTYYDPYGVVPCISYACPGNAVGFP